MFDHDDFFGGSLFGRRGGNNRRRDDDFFGGSMFGMMGGNSRRRDDDFFGGGMDVFGSNFGNLGGFSSMSYSSSSGGGGMSKSVKTVTETINGQTVTKTVTKIKHPDGRVET